MGFDFDEAGQEKSYTFVELDGKGETTFEFVPFKPKRQIKIIEGTLQELIAAGQMNPTADFVEARLSDQGALVDPMGQLRATFPHVMNIERTQRTLLASEGGMKLSRDIHEPQKLIAAFSQEVRGTGLSEDENSQILKLLARIQGRDN